MKIRKNFGIWEFKKLWVEQLNYDQTKHAIGSKICENFGIWNFKKLWGEQLNYENLYSKIIQFNSLILGEQKETIRALRTCGAHLQMGPLELGEKLCSFARLGDRKKLKCFKLAGTQNLAKIWQQIDLQIYLDLPKLILDPLDRWNDFI